jgi:hypothetical protein
MHLNVMLHFKTSFASGSSPPHSLLTFWQAAFADRVSFYDGPLPCPISSLSDCRVTAACTVVLLRCRRRRRHRARIDRAPAPQPLASLQPLICSKYGRACSRARRDVGRRPQRSGLKHGPLQRNAPNLS